MYSDSFRVCRRNIKKEASAQFLKTCKFDASTEDGLYCPIFSLEQIVSMIEPKPDYDFRSLSVKVGEAGYQGPRISTVPESVCDCCAGRCGWVGNVLEL